ncbi:HEAT repeat domain-containing protein [Thiorhodococcus minor]|uniref:HEAT repeat domain-containing protein n=1 Tax=Thiorhodococcus minor TaxID=57489 RepID=A0A6M0K3U8_9GAMM|nr:HEAT repeat domain-containing protein [Thiorhodococcus minor]NEV64488.1 HEAT repeat domain-containing protein [Thiorhodococcus minor]
MRSILMALVITPMIALAGDRQSFEGLVADLEAADPETGLSAVQKLAEGGDARAVPLLIAALQRDMKARTGLLMAIIPALGELGDPSAVPILLLALNNRDDHWIAREAAAQALGAIGAPEAVPDLIKAAWMVDTREAAITALAQIADERAVEVLVTALDPAEDAGVREQALAGLIHIGRPAVPALTAVVAEGSGEYPNTAQRALAAYALGKIGDPRAHAALEQAAQDPSAEVRASASKALGRLQ